MDKNAIKKYAVWARNELIARVTQKAEQYEITERKTTPADTDRIGGRVLTATEKNQRKALIEKIHADGFEQVMEEVAYTWFNRFIALRFMEVNNYLPSHTRVFTNELDEFKPQILADAIQLDLVGLDMDKVFELKTANKTEELYKYLLVIQCNALSAVLPRMFQKIEHYTELLLPDYLLREGSVIEQMITLIPEEDWTDQVQIIGWLYQYYNSEPKDAVFAALKKNVKISKENIPAATQLFTPDWIVRYMVENSLGRLWLEGHPNNVLKSEWEYYVDEVEQEEDVQKQLDGIHKEYATLKPEEIRCIDPCMGSGHIVCYIFDVLVKIYESYGYSAREAVENIVKKNLWGLDIDERAAQLSYFAVMMKARQYDHRFLTRKIQPHVYVIEESNGITSVPVHNLGRDLSEDEYEKAVREIKRLIDEMHDAKEYGSLIHVTSCDWELLRRFAAPRVDSERQIMLDIHGINVTSERLQALINIGEVLSQKYNVVVTNPPYMGNKNLKKKLSAKLRKLAVNDMYQAFMLRTNSFLQNNGRVGIITKNDWLKKSKSEEFRKTIYESNIEIICDLGAHAFEALGGEIVGFCILISQKSAVVTDGLYADVSKENDKESSLLNYDYNRINKVAFEFVPRFTVFPQMNVNDMATFENSETMEIVARPRSGMTTGDSERFIHNWYEISNSKMYHKWFPVNVGGTPTKWYGNKWTVINWENNGSEISNNPGCTLANMQFQQAEGITWGKITSGSLCVRYSKDSFFTASGLMAFPKENYLFYVMSLLNSKVSDYYLDYFRSGLDILSGDIANIPITISEKYRKSIDTLGKQCIYFCKEDWDSQEISWDFLYHPLTPMYYELKKIIHGKKEDNRRAELLSHYYRSWEKDSEQRFYALKSNEEDINQIFINIYGLQNVLNPKVEEKSLTIRKADLKRDIRSLVSYAVGCMFGRYSLNVPGLAYAGGEWDASKYETFQPDKDAIIPICDDEYFEDDIVGRFVKFIEVVYGRETLEENLKFIADALGGKGTSREVIRSYFMNDFYSDHLKVYQKRPIYWLFDSGKKNGFKCLIYMHRYQSDTIARIRTDYVHEQQSRYRTVIADLEQRINGATTSDRVKLNKRLSTLQAQAEEIRKYEEKIHHLADQMISIDLDDGVKHNYEIFKDVLAKIK